MTNKILDNEWLKRIIDEAIQEVLNENKQKEEHHTLSADELKKYGIAYCDVKGYSAHEIARTLHSVFVKIKHEGEETSDFYCEITNDIVTRKSDHENKDYDGKKIDYVIALQCADMITAADTEYIMHKRFGFNMGQNETYANGAALDSDYVYYRIPQ